MTPMERLWARSGLSTRDLVQRLEALDAGQTEALRMLSVFDNDLDRLPDELAALKHLETLIANHNRIASAVAVGGLTNLTRLYLASNELVQLPDQLSALSRLERLDVSRNRLAALPDMSSLERLERFDCHGNELRELPALPKSIRILGCFSNALKNVDPVMACPVLAKLNCAFNGLSLLPEKLPGSLVYIKADGNRILRVDLSGLPLLEKLELADNGLRLLTGLDEKSNSLLRVLHLAGNALPIAKLNCNADSDVECAQLVKLLSLAAVM